MLSCGCGGGGADDSSDSLLPYINFEGVSCLNESRAGSARHVLKASSRANEVGCGASAPSGDALLVFLIPFTCAVRIRAVCVRGAGAASARLLVNAEGADAEAAAGGAPAAAELALGGASNGAWQGVKPSRFGAVHHLTLAVAGGAGAGADAGAPLEVFFVGLRGDGTGARAAVVHAAYEARAQPADHAAPAARAGGGGALA
jgi:hypothetical protein